MPAAKSSRRTTLRFSDTHMIDFGTGGLLVRARAGDEDVVCRISTIALEEHGATPGDEASSWAAYRRIARRVQRAAARKYAAGERQPDGSVFIGSVDIA